MRDLIVIIPDHRFFFFYNIFKASGYATNMSFLPSGTTFVTSCLVPLTTKTFLKWKQFLKERLCSSESKLFPLKADFH